MALSHLPYLLDAHAHTGRRTGHPAIPDPAMDPRRVSGRLVEEVLDYAPDDLPKLDLLVLVALAAEARDTDRTAKGKHTGAEAIARRVRSTPSSVSNALGRLRQRALIRPVHAKVHRGQQQNWIITKLSDYHREGATTP